MPMPWIRGEIDAKALGKALDEGPAVPVFESAYHAAKHGRKSIKRPSLKARDMMAKIEKKRGN